MVPMLPSMSFCKFFSSAALDAVNGEAYPSVSRNTFRSDMYESLSRSDSRYYVDEFFTGS